MQMLQDKTPDEATVPMIKIFTVSSRHFFFALAQALCLSGLPASADTAVDHNTIMRSDIPADAPRFEDFKVPVFTGKSARPAVRKDKRSWLFRTELREAAAEGANFAGHYRLASWGCGPACFQWALIDVKSGQIFHPANLASTDHVNVEEGLYEEGIHAVHSRSNSRLLVVIGGINENPKQRGISWFVWDGQQLKRVRFVAKPDGGS
jgi:hypothetical protein